jgi:DNA topoisomerase VI subunit B
MSALLDRTTFTTSRLLEFFTEKELSLQIGRGPGMWPIALLKELIDNALDACETAGTPPAVEVTVGPDAFSVRDNGPGLPDETLRRSLDYAVRVSSNSYYVSPTRGQLGNALKCLWAAPFVAGGSDRGLVEVEAHGVCHRVDVRLDRIAQRPALEHTTGTSVVKNGTLVRVHWPRASCLGAGGGGDFYNARLLVGDYATLNPHSTFVLRDDDALLELAAAAPAWEKWTPGTPTCPHWYSPGRLRSLIAAYLAEERAGARGRTVREFVAEFAGLAGTSKQKAVAQAARLAGCYLRDLVRGGDVDAEAVGLLLRAMQEQARPIKPIRLGVLGEAHLSARLVQGRAADPEAIWYKRSIGTADGLPFVLEVALGVKGGGEEREVVVGLNWSPALGVPFRSLDVLLGEMRVDETDPLVLLVHLTCPRLEFTDHGKGHLVLPRDISTALAACVRSVAKPWKQYKRRNDRIDQEALRQARQAQKARPARALSIREAAYEVMERAYLLASNNGTLPANARQVMYAARPLVLERTGGRCWKESSYFTQHLLVDFIRDNPETAAAWDVVFDDRGHFVEPNTRRSIGLGTLQVRHYIGQWQDGDFDEMPHISVDHECPTFGPANRYRFALFVEKEGFNQLLQRARIAERFDLAVMSTKGMSVTAARHLVERLSEEGVTVLVLRDFDKSGFSIVHTLQADTRRFQYGTRPRVTDLGLRLEDVRRLALQGERVEYRSKKDPRLNLRECGATAEECDFLVRGRAGGGWAGERVELNAMPSDRFITFLEGKLTAAGVGKLVPDAAALSTAYRRARRLVTLQQAIDAAVENPAEDSGALPKDLEDRVRRMISGTAISWDEALWRIARQGPADPTRRRRKKVAESNGDGKTAVRDNPRETTP